MLRKVVAFLLLTSSLCAESHWKKRLDLERLLNDPQAMQSLMIAYVSYDNKLSLFVFGNGRVVTQPTTATTDLVPTCSADISDEQIRSLVQLLIKKRFFDLPQEDFIMLNASVNDWAKIQVQTIRVMDDEGIASRSFGAGYYNGQKQSLPSDFSDIRVALEELRQTAFPKGRSTPCTFETQIKK